MDRNLISQRQIDALKLEALRAYFDSRRGGGPAHGRERGERSCEVPLRTVREWFGDNRNAEHLDEIVPLWPNIGSARQFASEHVQEALQTMVELMRSGKSEKVRMDAAATLTAGGQYHDDLAVRFPNLGVCCILAIAGRLQKESNL